MKKIYLLGMLAAFMLAGCSSAKTSESTAASETTTVESKVTEETTKAASSDSKTTFTVGFDQDFPPMGFVGYDGEFTGFDLDLAAEVARRLGKEIKYQPIAWDAKDMELSSGTIDCIWNGFSTQNREDKYTWTKPYMKNDQVFVVRSDSDINSFDDLAGKTVEVQIDSSAEAVLKENTKLSDTFGKLQTVADFNTGFMDLEMGGVDALAMNSVVANYQITKRDAEDFKVLDTPLSSEEYAVGFKLGNEALRDEVQKALDEMKDDGTLKTISEKWFGKDVTILE
ncbi:amino acid ABC transporter substrate-binding protein [Lachnoanaerobaculum umeaense]|uniref:ABC transporter substrate-binding protein n=1 Tax=Lachnoanaerobaculum umeaense TaxID=617123 RepID=A0A385Q1N4_9FIRM|nr:amino acid ABC transporter substrate-binding protein [Lachnoanaerobaculum umeaense]AYB00312.1 ABC transporter substrate-binding protein [Lachnoanaerobaculum umeaense]PZW96065.1 amino acid ABC transporter substrate-binding protein (PAAT family) [Lachnoanaerobaculum umeaense]